MTKNALKGSTTMYYIVHPRPWQSVAGPGSKQYGIISVLNGGRQGTIYCSH